MIYYLFPRCPFSSQEMDDIYTKRDAYAERLRNSRNWNNSSEDQNLFVVLIYEANPDYRAYRQWLGLTDGYISLYGIERVYECEYTQESKEWRDFIELKKQLIEEQGLPFDSPEWQAVIEKFRRKDGCSRLLV